MNKIYVVFLLLINVSFCKIDASTRRSTLKQQLDSAKQKERRFLLGYTDNNKPKDNEEGIFDMDPLPTKEDPLALASKQFAQGHTPLKTPSITARVITNHTIQSSTKKK